MPRLTKGQQVMQQQMMQCNVISDV